MTQIAYVLAVLSGSIIMDTESLGNDARSNIFMGPREGVDGVGRSEFDE